MYLEMQEEHKEQPVTMAQNVVNLLAEKEKTLTSQTLTVPLTALQQYAKNHAHTVRMDESLTITEKDDNILLHGAMGLVTESAELIDLIKKKYYGKKKPYDKAKVMDEAGDVFWYLWLILDGLGISFEEMLAYNNKKLEERYKNA